MKTKLPKHVHGYLDRLGKARFYYKRKGAKGVPLPGLPWSPQFMAAYNLAHAAYRGQAQSHPAHTAAIRGRSMLHWSSITAARTSAKNWRTRHADRSAASWSVGVGIVANCR